MSETAARRQPIKPQGFGLGEIVSVPMLPPLPYTSILIPEHMIKETMFQIAKERQAKEREAALDGNDQ